MPAITPRPRNSTPAPWTWAPWQSPPIPALELATQSAMQRLEEHLSEAAELVEQLFVRPAWRGDEWRAFADELRDVESAVRRGREERS